MMTQEEILEDLEKEAQIQFEEELEEVNFRAGLGSLKPVFISSQLTAQEKEQLVALLKRYVGVFAWTYDRMSGLDPGPVVHSLNVALEVKLVVQLARVFHTNHRGLNNSGSQEADGSWIHQANLASQMAL